MKRKIALFAAAGLLTTATIVTATVRSEKKPPVKKEVKAEKKGSKCNKGEKRMCIGSFL